MSETKAFGEVLEAADSLSLEDQETLIDVLHRRTVERRRAELARDIEEARRELEDGQCRPVSPSELMREIAA